MTEKPYKLVLAETIHNSRVYYRGQALTDVRGACIGVGQLGDALTLNVASVVLIIPLYKCEIIEGETSQHVVLKGDKNAPGNKGGFRRVDDGA